MSKIAFLGLGKMGSGMAGRLLGGGHDVAVWNRDPAKAADLVARGARLAATPAQAARDATAVFSMVADDEASSRCWLGPDGALATAPRGAFAIECSTVSHGQALNIAAASKAKGLTYLDCPVNGAPSAAAAGNLILLVGAEPADLERARPLLSLISSQVLHFGPVGTGTAFKLINNLMGAVHIAGLAEGIALARKLGLDARVLQAAIESGPCASPHVKRLVPAMSKGEISTNPGLSIGLREKDSRYCLALAKDAGLALPVGREAHAWYAAAKPTLGPDDDSAILKTVEKSA